MESTYPRHGLGLHIIKGTMSAITSGILMVLKKRKKKVDLGFVHIYSRMSAPFCFEHLVYFIILGGTLCYQLGPELSRLVCSLNCNHYEIYV
jgi:hypothetical protein